MAKDEWTKVFSSNQLYQAQMVHDLLQQEDIEAVLIDKQDSFYHFGDIEVYVKPENVVRAKHFINKLEL